MILSVFSQATAPVARRALLALAAFAMMVPLQQAAAQVDGGDGFLFHAPNAALTVRVGYAQPSADSKIFSFTTGLLTLGKGNFAGGALATDLEFPMTGRTALVFGVGLSASDARSEYRDFVDNKDLPIEQRTEFRRVPISVGVKYFLAAPGRSVGRFVWVPTKMVPYVAAGLGSTYYTFKQSGDFIDFKTNDVFTSTLTSAGWGASAYGAAGFQYGLTTHADLVTEARYDRGRAPMSADFQGFDRISLSGLSLSTGIHLRF